MSRRFKKLISLFSCGVLIGVCLEVIFIEKNIFNQSHENNTMRKTPRVTCLIVLKHNHDRYINSTMNTWIKHCDNYHIINVQNSQKRKTNSFNVKSIFEVNFDYNNNNNNQSGFGCEGNFTGINFRNYVKNILAKSAWEGLCKTLHTINSCCFEWLIIVPDSVFVLVENLKLFVKNLNSDENHYFGYALEHYEANFNTLSAGILLSRGCLTKLFKKFQSKSDCENTGKHWKNEDLYLGLYLKELGIFPMDTRDKEGRGRFHGFNLNTLLWPGKLFYKSDYHKKALYPVPKGSNCCSPFSVTVDLSDPTMAYKIYFFLYMIGNKKSKKSNFLDSEDIKGFSWKDFLKERGYNDTAIDNISPEEYYQIWEKILPPEKMYQEMRNFIQNTKS